MANRILVAYASRFGATREVAEAIARTIREAGAEVDLIPAVDAEDIRAYRAVLLGSPINQGQWLPSAIEFVNKHREQLESRPVVYFVVGLTLRRDTPKNRAKMRQVLDFLPKVNLVATGLFGGSVRQVPWPLRILLMLVTRVTGDLRDWEAIEGWTRDLLPRLGLG